MPPDVGLSVVSDLERSGIHFVLTKTPLSAGFPWPVTLLDRRGSQSLYSLRAGNQTAQPVIKIE